MSTRHMAHLRPPVVEGIRLTIPAREAIERAGNRVTTSHTPVGPRYDVELRAPPRGLVLVLVDSGHAGQSLALRLPEEPEYPGEFGGGAGVAWWDRGQWVPCPTCGATLLWCEAGFVPGWRICLSGHAVQLAADGRSAKRHAKQDAATLRSTRPL